MAIKQDIWVLMAIRSKSTKIWTQYIEGHFKISLTYIPLCFNRNLEGGYLSQQKSVFQNKYDTNATFTITANSDEDNNTHILSSIIEQFQSNINKKPQKQTVYNISQDSIKMQHNYNYISGENLISLTKKTIP